jgi:uncharacterized MAPEG superfamily protein
MKPHKAAQEDFVTTPFWCLLIVAVIPILVGFSTAYFKNAQLGSVDNAHPRAQALELTGSGARSVAAQANAWEAVALFTVAVTVAHLAGADPGKSATAAIVFLLARVAHPIFYIGGVASARSASFLIAFASIIWMFVLAARA